MAVKTEYPHIVLDENEVPTIEGTSMKVAELVIEHIAYGWSPEELHLQHSYLTLGQVCAAMAYYWDHTEQLEKEISKRLKRVEELRKQAEKSPSPLVHRLKVQGRLCGHI